MSPKSAEHWLKLPSDWSCTSHHWPPPAGIMRGRSFAILSGQMHNITSTWLPSQSRQSRLVTPYPRNPSHFVVITVPWSQNLGTIEIRQNCDTRILISPAQVPFVPNFIRKWSCFKFLVAPRTSHFVLAVLGSVLHASMLHAPHSTNMISSEILHFWHDLHSITPSLSLNYGFMHYLTDPTL
jgi:hypothetical protein